jgi:hypothetical protein
MLFEAAVTALSASEIGNQGPVLIVRILAGSITGLDKETDDDQANLFDRLGGRRAAAPA